MEAEDADLLAFFNTAASSRGPAGEFLVPVPEQGGASPAKPVAQANDQPRAREDAALRASAPVLATSRSKLAFDDEGVDESNWLVPTLGGEPKQTTEARNGGLSTSMDSPSWRSRTGPRNSTATPGSVGTTKSSASSRYGTPLSTPRTASTPRLRASPAKTLVNGGARASTPLAQRPASRQSTPGGGGVTPRGAGASRTTGKPPTPRGAGTSTPTPRRLPPSRPASSAGSHGSVSRGGSAAAARREGLSNSRAGAGRPPSPHHARADATSAYKAANQRTKTPPSASGIPRAPHVRANGTATGAPKPVSKVRRAPSPARAPATPRRAPSPANSTASMRRSAESGGAIFSPRAGATPSRRMHGTMGPPPTVNRRASSKQTSPDSAGMRRMDERSVAAAGERVRSSRTVVPASPSNSVEFKPTPSASAEDRMTAFLVASSVFQDVLSSASELGERRVSAKAAAAAAASSSSSSSRASAPSCGCTLM